MAASASFAQVNWKFEPTDYRGAFAPAPTPMWTNGWTNFDPQTTVYPAPTVTVSANITTNTTWSSSSVYLLSGPIYVTNNATLTIQPGTVIRGNAAVAGSALIITKGAKIIADGTLAQPIVFTSSAAPGSRAIGDWGGIVVLGKASNNLPANATAGTPAGIGNIEGLPVSANSEYGGGATPDDNDYSGILRYIRLEFGGYAYQIDKEINGFTFGSVGAATVAEYLQTSFVNDDAFEWFGGTMNAKYLVAYRCLDDDMDCDFGYRGKVQFGLIVRDPNIADQSSGSTSEGFECDNDGAGSTNTPKTAAMFSNFTAIGPLRGNPSATINSKFERALRLRRNSEMKILNSIFMDWKRGLHIDGTAAEARAGEDALRFRNNIIAGCQPSNKIVTTSATFNHKKYVADNMNDTLISAAGILVNPYNYTAPDYRPATGSIALTNADFNDQGFPQFTATSFRGAFAPAPVPMWTDSWTNFDPANTIYPTATVTVSANITVDTRWTANNTYLLSGPIYVNNNATLTIEPGTVIRGNKAIAGSALVITKGAKLIANGTKNAPIVFTSSGGVGNRAIGDWGGIVILGKAANNLPANATAGTAAGIGNIEGLPVSADSEYGGGATPNDNDNSGILKYVRIEFGGYAYQIDKEINGLTMGSVGRSTVIDYVQTSYTNDDSFEWFGGTVNAKHLVAYRGLDDDMDCDFGYRGQIQYVLIVRDPAIADQSSGSTSEGFECDNDGSGSTNSPKTAATFSNVTAIGPLRGNVNATIDPKHERALRLRRNSEMKIHNSIFMDFKKGLFIDGTTTEAQATSGNLLFKNNILAGYRPANGFFVASGSTFNIKNFFATNANDSLTSSANILTTPYNYTAPDYRPAVGSLALTGAAFTAAPFAGNVACGLAAPSISGSLSVCQGSSSTLSAPAGFTYLWSNGATTQTINVTAAGNYTVTITDGLGCSNSTTASVTITTRPTVSITGTASICAGQSVTLTANGGATYTWGSGATTSTLTVSPTATATYTVIGANASGCTDTATFAVTVVALPALSGTPTVTNASCGLSNGSISGVAVTGTGLTYNWTNAASQAIGTTANLSNLPAGVYTLSVTNSNGCAATFGPYTITNPSTPPAITTNPSVTNAGCGQSNGSVSGAVFSGTGLTYDWKNSSNTTVGTSANLTNVPAGVYNVTVTNAAGCTAAFGPYSVANFSAPSAPSVTAVDSVLCVGETIQLTAASAASGATFTWSGPNGFTSTSALVSIPNATVANSGLYSVTVTSNGCVSSSASKNIAVNAIPTVTTTGIDTVLCAGETLQLTASTLATGATYSWTGPNFTSSSATITITNVTAANAGLYSVTISLNGCVSAPSTKSIVVNNLPAVTVLSFVDTTCVNYAPATLAGAPAGGTFSGSGVNGASFDPAVAGVGTHVVTYAYTDANGCSNTATTSIVVDACVGLGESAINSIRVFPNPTNTVINVASTREDIAVVVLTNSVGEVVARVRGTQLDASQFANGLYFVTAIFEDGSSAVGRVTILN